MNTKLLLTAACVLMGLGANAQATTLTAANTTPRAGDVYSDFYVNYYSPGPAGANQTWDFSGLVPDSFAVENVHYIKTCASSSDCNLYAGANLVDSTSVGGVIRTNLSYYVASTVAYSTCGYYYTDPASGDFLQRMYANNEDNLRYPLAYGNSYVDLYTVASTSTQLSGHGVGADSITVDGWGTLKTPVGTFANTIRVKTVTIANDTSGSGSNINTSTVRTIQYKWYDGVNRRPLFSSYNFTNQQASPGSQSYTQSVYTVANSTGIGTINGASNAATWSITPNPASTQIKLSITLNTAAVVGVSVTDITGRVVSNIPARTLAAGASTITLPVSDLPAGMYTVGVSAGGVSSFKKMIVVQ